MKPAVTRRQGMMLGASLALGAGVWAGLRFLPPVDHTSDAELAALTAERAGLQNATDTSRDEWRQKAAALDHQNGAPVRREELEASIGPGWRWTWQPPEAGHRTAVLSREAASLHDWPEVLAVLRGLETHPGLTVEKVEIRTAGTGTNRRFSRIAVTLRIAVETNRNPARAASLGPRPVSGLAGSAGSREVGRAAALSGRCPPPAPSPDRRPGPPSVARPTTREHGLILC